MSAHIYNFGGYDENCSTLSSVSHLDLTSGSKWVSCPEMPNAKINFGGAVIGTKIYVCGGYAVGRLNVMEMLDCVTNRWSVLSPIPEVRNECSAAAMGDHSVYVSGGGDPDNENSASVFRYDVKTDHWSTVSKMLEPRSSHQLVALNGRLYAINGCPTNTVEQYDSETDKWRYVSSTEHSHYCFGAAVLNDKIYICSHYGFEEYSPESGSWRTLPHLNEYIGRTLVAVNGKLWAIGGSEDGKGATRSVFEFDFSAEKWTQIGDLDATRKNHFSCVANF